MLLLPSTSSPSMPEAQAPDGQNLKPQDTADSESDVLSDEWFATLAYESASMPGPNRLTSESIVISLGDEWFSASKP
jgi:hypothetical protein